MKYVKSLFALLSLSLCAGFAGCSVDVCDVDADCLYYPDAICYQGHCANKCMTQYDCDAHRDATYCADYSMAYGLCLPVRDYDCWYDYECADRGREYICENHACVLPVTIPSDVPTYGECYYDDNCYSRYDVCFANRCTPSCSSNRDCTAGMYCDSSVRVCVYDPNYNWASQGAGERCYDDTDCYNGSQRCLYNRCYQMCRYSSDCNAGRNGVCDYRERVCMYY